MPRHRSFHIADLLFATAILVVAGARAAELGEAKVNSYIGQQLSADIELTSIHDAAGTVQVRIASLDVYRGAGLDMPAVLSSLNLNVVRRDGKQFLHVTTTRPIEADHLHLYLELSDGGARGVRLATLWFTPDPAPPPPRIVAAPLPVPPVIQEIAPARALPSRQQKPVRPLPEPVRVAAKDESRPVVAAEAKPAEPKVAKAASAPPESKPAKPVEAPPVKAAAAPAEPKPAHAAPSSAEQPKPLLAAAAARAKQPPPAAIPLPKPAPACPKEPAQAESAACTGLDSKNGELRAELVKLEARVKMLQEQEEAHAAAAAKAAAAPKPVQVPAPVEPAKPVKPAKAAAIERPAADEKFGQVIDEAPAPVFRPVKLKPVVPAAPPPNPEAEPAGMPWGWIAGAGAGVFALIGGLQFWRHRRQQAQKAHRVHAPLPETDDEELIEPTLV